MQMQEVPNSNILPIYDIIINIINYNSKILSKMENLFLFNSIEEQENAIQHVRIMK